MNQITEGVKSIIIINVIFFAGVYLPAMLGYPDATQWFRANLALYFPTSSQFQPWQLITHMFMHADFGHLIFNMLTLFFLGPLVERTLGIQRFLLLYFVAGFTAMILHQVIDYMPYLDLVNELGSDALLQAKEQGYTMLQDARAGANINFVSQAQVDLILLENTPMLGASGAVYGVLVAFAVLYPNLKMMLMFIPVPIKAKYLALGYVAYDLILGVGRASDGIAHFAHIGGAIAGFLLIYFWKKKGL